MYYNLIRDNLYKIFLKLVYEMFFNFYLDFFESMFLLI